MITILIILAVLILLWKLTPKPTDKRTVSIMFQMLETFHIIDTTIKLDVFTQRLEFIGQLATNIPANADKNKCIDAAIQAYSRRYINLPISPTSRLILNQPQIAYSPKFRDEAITAFYMRYCYKLRNEIATLKTNAAKQRRKTQAAELADIVKAQLYSLDKQKYSDAVDDTYDNLTTPNTPITPSK